jgi:hypothetical protein
MPVSEDHMGLLVVIVLLLVVMPALIYALGWAAKRYSGN